MKVSKVSQGAGLADPASPAWNDVVAVAVALSPVPLDAQPNAYIREAWKGRAYGQTAEARVAAATDSDRLYLRVEWPDDAAPNQEFQDAVGAVFPSDGGGVLKTLGDIREPVVIWYWESGRPGPLSLLSRGPGAVSKQEGAGLSANGALQGQRWAVAFSGPAAAAAKGRVGVAVWNGSNEERAGLAAVSPSWLSLEL